MQIILHDEAQLVDWGESRSLGPWIKLRLTDPELLESFRGMDTATQKKAGHILNLTLSEGDIVPCETSAKRYGQEAAVLRKSGFFYRPEVWRAIGIDIDYQEWVRDQKCIVCGGQDWVEQQGVGKCEYAHVRRDSGFAIKPEFSGVPLCHKHHVLQHTKGELAAYREAIAIKGQPTCGTLKEAREWLIETQEWFEQKALSMVVKWAWFELKTQLGAESWSNIEPKRLRIWAEAEGVEKYLPDVYKNAES